jgi:elongator complex protein 3
MDKFENWHKPENRAKKPVRTISGVTPLTVVLKPRKCDHGTCIYCPGGDYVPQSYTDKSPAVMRAINLGFDPYEQVKNRLYVLDRMGHPTDKIEIIVLGGTFLQYDLEYQYNFIKRCFDALNGEDSETLEEAKKKNETAEHRCIAMCIENRPDNCSPEEIERMLEFGATRIEIGVQMPDDEMYRKTNRGHKVKDVVEASERLKDAGFKLGYHIMPGLPYSNPEKDIDLFDRIFSEEKFRPDQLKIYPCQVIEDSPLAKIHEEIGYTPYTEEQTKDILDKMMRRIPRYCRVMRVIREFPKEKLVDGIEKLDLRKDVEEDFRKNEEPIKEIRMREIGFNKNLKKDIDLNAKMKITEYNSSNGKEYFLEFVNKDDILFGLLRLRISKGKAMVRELHVYGHSVKIGEKEENAAQHTGLGKALLEKAEEITKENKIDKLSIISGIGVREYYKKLGYGLEAPYMIKKLN